MLSYVEAIRIVLDRIRPLPAVEVPLQQALGRVLAEPLNARWDMPTADNSAMDGYAFAFAGQTAGNRLPVAGFLPAGSYRKEPVPQGQAVKIMTGAPIPEGCDTVVPIEGVCTDAGGICLENSPISGQHIRRRGEEIREGEELLAAGTAIHSGELGLLASAGIERLKVHPTPKVALLSTGDELVELGQQPGPGQIINSNYYLLSARLCEEGCPLAPLPIARDRGEALSVCIKQGLAAADMLITTGGVSVGDRDLVQQTLDSFGFELGFWKVSIKPGKPVLFGTACGKPVFGLPGNPAASAATFELFARPALRRLAGHGEVLPPHLRVILSEPVRGGESRQRFVWGNLEEQEGRYHFTPSDHQGSGQNRGIQGAQALLPVDGGSQGIAAGSEVDVLLLRLPPDRATP